MNIFISHVKPFPEFHASLREIAIGRGANKHSSSLTRCIASLNSGGEADLQGAALGLALMRCDRCGKAASCEQGWVIV